MIWNILGVIVAVGFVAAVDWSLWVPIPVGLILPLVVVLMGGVIKGSLNR